MLNKKNRFSCGKSFDRVKSTGQIWKGKYMLIRFLTQDLSDFKAAVVASKKVVPKAVKRNKIRRRVYETIRLCRKEHSLANPLHMIVFVNKKINTASFQDISDEIQSFLTSQS